MGRHERESLAMEAQRLALICQIRESLVEAFVADGIDPNSKDHLIRTIDSVLNDYR